MPQWQVLFDGGHQQRYLPDRRAVLSYVLAVGPHAASPRFEVHADGTVTVIREYRADGSYHIMSDRGEIELIDNANDPYAADPVSVVRLP